MIMSRTRPFVQEVSDWSVPDNLHRMDVCNILLGRRKILKPVHALRMSRILNLSITLRTLQRALLNQRYTGPLLILAPKAIAMVRPSGVSRTTSIHIQMMSQWRMLPSMIQTKPSTDSQVLRKSGLKAIHRSLTVRTSSIAKRKYMFLCMLRISAHNSARPLGITPKMPGHKNGTPPRSMTQCQTAPTILASLQTPYSHRAAQVQRARLDTLHLHKGQISTITYL